jgi:hypothetical protein
MSANVTVSFSNELGFPTGEIPEDAYNFITDPILLSRAVKSAWEGSIISVDITYTAEADDGTGNNVVANVTSHSSSYNFAAIGLNYTITSNNTARISGKTANLFPGSYYRFRMPDGTFKILPPDTTEDFFALVEYNMPTPTSREETYPVTISVDAAGIEPKQNVSINLTEYHYWKYQSAVATVKDLVSRGKQ